MPRYSISNVPTEMVICQLDPAEIGRDQGIYISLSLYIPHFPHNQDPGNFYQDPGKARGNGAN